MAEPYISTRCANCHMKCIFSDFADEKNSDRLQAFTREITFNKGETIYKQNTFISHIVFIREGLAKLTLEGMSGKDYIVRLYKSQDYIGLIQAFRTNESRYTVVVMKSTRVCLIEVNLFRKMIVKHIHLNEKLSDKYVEEIDLLYQRLTSLGTKSIHGRLADILLYLSDEKLVGEDVYAHISRKDIAEMSGMSVESALRLLNELKHDKIITVKGKRIEISNDEIVSILSKAG